MAKSKRIKWSDNELVIALAYYVFVYKHHEKLKRETKFTKDFDSFLKMKEL